ncbi:phosphotransferase family protein [Celeribacter sp.]|uniref:phosphotransferase family protein n=1 Tax=Celeribacter sp. TaxID=1890673 RepID=UPI003A904455
MDDLFNKCAALVEELGIASREAVTRVGPLTGGVASDIARVEVSGRTLAVKFALPKLKVAADWRAPVHRNSAEYAWLSVAAQVAPEGAVKLYGRSEADHGFAMEFITGDDVYLWKDRLLSGALPEGEAGAVGDVIGGIHAASTVDGFDAAPFDNADDFRALRIEPYLTYTARRHAGVAQALTALADMLYAARGVLVHGDVSPKNILLRDGRPVMLDAECATMGDASFDPAFCLNHLVLKSFHLPQNRAALLGEVGAFWSAYAQHVTWEDPAELEARIAALLPALMLARVDGKSPVEYLNDATRAQVRTAALALVVSPEKTLSAFVGRLNEIVKEQGA